jgi:prepilin-type N-terminal cleavage/methylation domain-containing protein
VKANPCPPSAGGARARGFTVIELVIAISVAAIVIVSIGANVWSHPSNAGS